MDIIGKGCKLKAVQTEYNKLTGNNYNVREPTGILFLIVLYSVLLILLASVAGRDIFQIPAQLQAVDVSCSL